MAILAVKLSDGSVQITNSSTGVVRTIAKGDKWNVNVSADYATLYHYDDPQVMVYNDPALTNGNSIFGQTTLAGLTAGIISGAIESSGGGGGGGAATSPADIGTGIDVSADVDTMITRLTEIRNELREVKSASEFVVVDSGVTPRYFVRTRLYDESTSSFNYSYLNLDGTIPTPAPVTPVQPASITGLQIVEDSYTSDTLSADYAVGDQVNILRLYKGTSLEARLFYNVTTQTAFASAPTMSDLNPIEDETVEILKNLYARRNRYSVQMFTAVTNDLVNNYWAIGNTIMLTFTEVSGVVTSNFVNRDNFSMPALAVGALGAPDVLTDLQPVEGEVWRLLSNISSSLSNPSDIIAAGSTSSLLGNNAQVVTIDVNSRPIKVDLDQDAGVTGSETLRVVSASDSPEIAILSDILAAQTTGGGAVSPIAGSVQTGLTAPPSGSFTSQVFTNANAPGVSFLVYGAGVASGANYFVETDETGNGDFNVTYSSNQPVLGLLPNSIKTPVLPNGVGGKARIRVQNLNSTQPIIMDVAVIYHSQFETGKVLRRGESDQIDDASLLVSLRNDAKVRITDGNETAFIAGDSGYAETSSPSLVVQASPNDYLEIDIVRSATSAVGSIISIGDRIRTIKRASSIDSSTLVTRYYNENKQAFVSFIDQDNAVTLPLSIEPNRTLGTSAFSKITDGTDTAKVRAGSSSAAVTDSALVVTLREPVSIPAGQSAILNKNIFQNATIFGVASWSVSGSAEALSFSLVLDAVNVLLPSLRLEIFSRLDFTNVSVLFDQTFTPPNDGTSTFWESVKFNHNSQQTVFVRITPSAPLNGLRLTAVQWRDLTGDTSVGLNVQKDSGAVNSNTIRTIEASDSPAVSRLTDGSQQSKITDGTNLATVKAASAKSVLTDTSLVVQASPNNYYDTLTKYQATVVTPGIVIDDVIERYMRIDIDGNILETTNWNTRSGAALSDTSLLAAAVVELKDAHFTKSLAGFQKITDGTNTTSVKAASTRPTLTDPALVVTLSGNSANMAGLSPSVTADRHGIVGGQYLTTDPTLTNNQQAPLALDSKGNLKVIEQTPLTSVVGSINPIGEGLITAGKALRRIIFTNGSGLVHFLQFHNSAAALVSGTAVPSSGWSIRVPANSTLVLGSETFGEAGEIMGADARWAISTTFGAYTLPSAANRLLMALQYKTTT